MGGHHYKSLKIPGGAGYKSLKIPGGAGISLHPYVRRRRKRRTYVHKRRRRQLGKGAFGDFLKTAGKAAAKSLAKVAVNQLEPLALKLGNKTKNKRLKSILLSDVTRNGIRGLSSFANKKLS